MVIDPMHWVKMSTLGIEPMPHPVVYIHDSLKPLEKGAESLSHKWHYINEILCKVSSDFVVEVLIVA